MYDIELEIFGTLKSMVIGLVVALLAMTPVILAVRLLCARPFKVGNKSELTKYNLLLSLGWLLTAGVCLVISTVEVSRLNHLFERVGDDFRVHDPSLPPDGFYYGSTELRGDFERLRELVAQTGTKNTEFIAKINRAYSARIPSLIEGRQPKIDGFFERTWPGVLEAVQKISEAGALQLRTELEDCDRAIERISYLEKRMDNTTAKLAEKGGNLFVALIILSVLMVFFMFFCVRGLFRNRETREGETNWGLAKRLWGLAILALLLVVATVVLSAVTVSFHNAIFATKDVLKESPMKSLGPKLTPAQPSSQAAMLGDFTRVWDAGLSLISSIGPAPVELSPTWTALESLKDQKEALIRKIDNGLENSKFGPGLRIQHERLAASVSNLNRVIFYTLLWVGVAGFGHSMLSLLFMI